MITLDIGKCTHRGGHKQNQDALRVCFYENHYHQKWLFAVADGMGGHRYGALASHMACDGLIKHTCRSFRCKKNESADEFCHRLHEAMILTDREVRLKGMSEEPPSCMGSTLSSLVLMPRQSIIANVGDSRIYRRRSGYLTCLTTDHTFVQEMVDQGEIENKAAEVHPLRHMLTQAIGGPEPLEHVELRIDKLRVGDQFLLCTDGLYNSVESEHITDILNMQNTSVAKARTLIDAALNNRTSDNATALVVGIVQIH